MSVRRKLDNKVNEKKTKKNISRKKTIGQLKNSPPPQFSHLKSWTVIDANVRPNRCKIAYVL